MRWSLYREEFKIGNYMRRQCLEEDYEYRRNNTNYRQRDKTALEN